VIDFIVGGMFLVLKIGVGLLALWLLLALVGLALSGLATLFRL
jgi:hypothetical protein